jgi:cysteine-rich repeat protein
MRVLALYLAVLAEGCVFDNSGVAAGDATPAKPDVSKEEGTAPSDSMTWDVISSDATTPDVDSLDSVSPDTKQPDLTVPDGPVPDSNPCGNGSLQGTETCDDHNLVPGDGCSATCQIEPGFICPTVGALCVKVTGVLTGAGTPQAFIGGTDGSPVTRPCPAGTLLVGFSSKWATHTSYFSQCLTQIVARCRATVMGAQGKVQWGAGTQTLAPVGNAVADMNTTIGNYGTVDCPTDTFVHGVEVHHEPGSAKYLKGLKLSCRALDVTGGGLKLGPAQPTALLGLSSAANGTVTCQMSPPRLAVGFAGREGLVVDAFTLLCGDLSPQVP